MRIGVLVIVLCAASYVWGLFTIRNHIFPYSAVRSGARLVRAAVRFLSKRASVPTEDPALDSTAGNYDVLFVGDSLTYGCDWRRFFPHLSIYNAAMMGETTHGALRYIESVAMLKAKRAFIMLGAKDFESVGYRCATSADLDEIMKNFRTISNTIMAHGTDIVILAALQVNRKLRGEYPNPHILHLNERLAAYAAEIGVPYVDLNEFLSDEVEGLRAEYTYDGIKLEEPAYKIWADKIAPFLQGISDAQTPGAGTDPCFVQQTRTRA